jgi:hypothetical protein
MKFVKLCGDEYWYLWEEFDMKLRNFKGGWRTIDENSDEWMLSTIIEAKSWYDLYKKTGFCHRRILQKGEYLFEVSWAEN